MKTRFRSLSALAAAFVCLFSAAVGRAQAPATDPFLGIPILTTGASAPGGPVTSDNTGTIIRTADGDHGMSVNNSAEGYSDSLLSTISSFSDAAFSFVSIGVTKADGTAGTIGSNVTGHRIDDLGHTMAGTGGTFVVNANGTFSFASGTDFSDLANGTSTKSAVRFVVRGTNGATSAVKDLAATLVVKVERSAAGVLSASVIGARYDDYGSSNKPTNAGTVFPDLKTFANSLLRYSFAGQAGSGVTVSNDGHILTTGVEAHGILAKAHGARGYDGRDADIDDSSEDGGVGGLGGPVVVTADGTITTTRDRSVAVLAWSLGGDGGQGGDSGWFRNSKGGGDAGTGGLVNVFGSGVIATSGAEASGIMALSQGGNGGPGGDGDTFYDASDGAAGGRGGTIHVQGGWTITTGGEKAHGIWAKSLGGTAGNGGSGGWTGTDAGGGGIGTEGGSVTVESSGHIHTSGDFAIGILGQSIGGFGGNGGSTNAIFYAAGGDGNAAGSGGSVEITNGINGQITTTGKEAHGIQAQSMGGGGGNGGAGGSLVAFGGHGASGGNAGDVGVTNQGSITVTGAGSRGIYAQSVGGGGGDGGSSTGFAAIGGDGSTTSDGGVVRVTNAGTITSSANAIFAQSIGGGGGSGGSSTGLFSMGGKGGAGGNADIVSVTSHGNLTTTEDNGTAIFAESLGGGGGNGGNSTAVGLFVAVAIGGEGSKGGTGSDVKVGVNVDTGLADPVTGQIRTFGDNANGIQAQSVGGGGGNGGYALSAAAGIGGAAAFGLGGKGGGGNNAASSTVYFGNASSRIVTSGDNANGIFAQSVGGGGGSGGFAIAVSGSTGFAASLSFGGDGGTGGNGGLVNVGSVLNPLKGLISTSGAHSYGVLAQSVGGGGGNGGLSIAGAIAVKGGGGLAFGGSGAGGGSSDAVTLYSQGTIVTAGSDSHGLFAQSVGGGGGSGGAAIAATLSAGNALNVSFGGSAASGGSAGTVGLTSRGTSISTSGGKSYAILAQSIGGGGGDGGFAISGAISGGSSVKFSMAGGGGAGGVGNAVTVTNSSVLSTLGNDSHALFAQSVGGGGGSGGFSVSAGIDAGSDVSAGIGGAGAAGGVANTVNVTNTATSVSTAGDHAYGLLAQSIGGGGGDGGFSVAGGISRASSVALGVGGPGATGGNAARVDVTSSSAIYTQGQLAHGLFAQSVGGGGGSGGFAIAGNVSSGTNLDLAIGGGAGSAGTGGQVWVTNSGAIATGGTSSTGQGSYGILAQSVGGGGGTGGFAGSIAGSFGGSGKAVALSVGGNGGVGGNSDEVHVTNQGALQTVAANSIGLFAQSIGGGGGDGGFGLAVALQTSASKQYSLGGTIGGQGGTAGDGQLVDITNYASIQTAGANSQGLFAQSIGGGGGNGGFAIAATGATGKEAKTVALGIGGEGGSAGDARAVTVRNYSSIVTLGDDSFGIQAQSLGGGGGNGGFSITGSVTGPSSKGLSLSIGGKGNGGGDAGTVTVLGSSGGIETLGARSSAIQAQSVGGGGGNGGFSGSLALGDGGSGPSKPSQSYAITVGGSGGVGGVGGDVNVGTALSALHATIETAGAEAIGIHAQSIGGGGGNGGFALAGAINLSTGQGPNQDVAVTVGGGGGTGNNAGNVLVNHVGGIVTVGDGAYGIEAQSIGGGGGNGGGARSITLQLSPSEKLKPGEKKAANKNTDLALAIGGNGAGASDAGAVTVRHVGDITTVGGDAHGIFAQSIGGGGGVGGDAAEGIPDILGLPLVDIALLKKDKKSKNPVKDLKIVVGGQGGSSGNADAVFARNDGVITTWGDSAHGIFAQSIGGGGGAGGTADLGLTGTLGIGGGTGSTGNGGEVRIEASGAISTIGDSAHAIFAQSIGGGGGATGDVDRGLTNYGNIGLGFAYGQGGGNAGDGGVVTVDSAANLFTFGSGSSGIFAQSIGGGGGVAGTLGNGFGPLSLFNFAGSVGGDGSASEAHVTQAGNITVYGDGANGIFAQSAAGADAGKAVDVTLNSGNILVYGTESNGIVAQSLGQTANGTVSVTVANPASTVMGGVDGAAVRFLDGAANTLFNRGTLTTMAGLDGTTIVGTAGRESITNVGTVVGSIDLGAELNAFRNEASGVLFSGDTLKIGSGNALTNLGTISPGGWSTLQTTTIDGNLVQSGAPVWNVDTRAPGESDRLHVNGSAQLAGSATTININQLAPWQSGSTFTVLEAAGGLTGGTFQLGTLNGVMPFGQTFSLVTSASDLQMTLQPSTGDFVWDSQTGGSWMTPFTGGATAWDNGSRNVYGTPGPLSDVRIATDAPTSMGADFVVNSLTFDVGGASLSGGNTLTLLAGHGDGVVIDRGDGDTVLGADVVLGSSQAWLNDSRGVFYVAGASIEGSGRTLTIQGGGTTVISAVIDTERGALVKEGSGTLYLTGANSYTGGTIIKQGVVIGDTLSLHGAITDNGGLVFDQAQSGVFAGRVGGTGWLVKRGNGALELTAAQSYSGGTWIAGGSLKGTTTSLQGDIIDDGLLQFDQQQAGTFAGRVNGTGQLLKSGNATLNFTGDSSAFQGHTTIAGGLFNVNGRLGGSGLMMQPGTTLGGNGVVPSTTISAGAVLAPGNSIGRLLVGGDATLSPGSSYRVETAADLSSDLLLVDGTLSLAGTLDVQASAERYHPINVFTVAVARELSGAFSIVTSTAANLVPSVQYGSDTIELTLRRNDVDFRQAGTAGNQTAVAEIYNRLVPSATGPMAALVNQLFDVSNPAAMDAFASMAGTHYQHIARSNLTSAQIVTSSALTRLAAVGGDFSADTNAVAATYARGVHPGVWFNGLSVDMRSRGDDGDPGARVPMRGMTFGADALATRHVTLGANGGYAVTDVTARRDGGDHTRSELLEGGLYGRYQLGGSRVDAALSYGRHENAMARRVSDGVATGLAVASLDGETLTGQLDYGYRQSLGHGFSVQPELRWQQGTLRLDGATERGAALLDLTVPDRRESSRRLLAGGRVGKLFRGRSGEFAIEARAAMAREYRTLAPVHATLAGDVWTEGFVITEPGHRDRSGVYGLSLSGRVSSLQFFANADAEVDGSMNGWAGTFGVNASW